MIEEYVAAELKLAKLLGWTEIERGGQSEHGINIPPDWLTGYPRNRTGSILDPLRAYVPQWTRRNEDALQLVIDYELNITFDRGRMWVKDSDNSRLGNLQEFWDHEHDKGSAVRYAIVMTAISKLERK